MASSARCLTLQMDCRDLAKGGDVTEEHVTACRGRSTEGQGCALQLSPPIRCPAKKEPLHHLYLVVSLPQPSTPGEGEWRRQYSPGQLSPLPLATLTLPGDKVNPWSSPGSISHHQPRSWAWFIQTQIQFSPLCSI